MQLQIPQERHAKVLIAEGLAGFGDAPERPRSWWPSWCSLAASATPWPGGGVPLGDPAMTNADPLPAAVLSRKARQAAVDGGDGSAQPCAWFLGTHVESTR